MLGTHGVVVEDALGDGCGFVVVARVVHQTGVCLIRKCFLRDEVAPTQNERIDVHLAGERIHCVFDCIGGFGTAGATVSVGRRHRGEHRCAREVERLGDLVDPAVQERTEQWYAWRDQLEVGAHVPDEADAQAGDLAVLVCSQLNVLDLRSAMNSGLSVLGSFFVPTHRNLERLSELHAQ